MIKIGRTSVSMVKQELYSIIRPNVPKLITRTANGKLSSRELLHLVVHLQKRPASFSYEAKRTIKYEILTHVFEEYEGEISEIARHGLNFLSQQIPSYPPQGGEQKPDLTIAPPSPLSPPTAPKEREGVAATIEELPPSHRYSIYDLFSKKR
ncbi:MAG: hypothetical protein WC500_01510 [Candidatus Margulisiibacteriota bacterium]